MIQLYFLKKNFDVQKAERFFKERRIPYQSVDLSKGKIGRREVEAVASQVGLDEIIDKQSKAWLECPARFSAGRDMILDALCQDPRRLKLPFTRCGKHAAVGFAPEKWEEWLKEEKSK